MTTSLRPTTAPDTAMAAPRTTTLPRKTVDAAVERTVRAVAPLWPLKHFVAVNPFFGLAGERFGAAAETVARTAGARMTMPREFYADAMRSGRLTRAHLDAALRAARQSDPVRATLLPADAVALEMSLHQTEPQPAPVPTVADVLAARSGTDWPRLVTERISQWAASYFDEGQAGWRSPWRDLPAFGAWHADAAHDRTAEVLGVAGFRRVVRSLPAAAGEATAAAIARLGLGADAIDTYLHRLAMSVGGWAAYARYQVWESELYGERDDTFAEFLAIRLAWEVALLDGAGVSGAHEAWREAAATIAAEPPAAERRAVAIDTVLQEAYELGWQEGLVARIGTHADAAATTAAAPGSESPTRPAVQAAFCIDVRSEVYRRALESVDEGIETIGFAGFFGFPIEYVPLGQEKGGAQCPVLLTPAVTIAETLPGASDAAVAEAGRARVVGRRMANAWKSFKMGAISCFGFVGPVGLAYIRKLVTDGLGLSRPVADPRTDHLPADAKAALGPTLDERTLADRATGLPVASRIEMAETVLGAMSMHENFARLVLLAGHGSTTVNNPHATGLDCGACGGHTGEANARVAALVLNDPAVREALVAKGVPLPEDTVFVAGLHDTTTDEVHLYDATVPASHQGDLARLREQLAAAARFTRAERAPALGLDPSAPATDADVVARSRDWSQVRPEWGLAGCAAFVAAPRHRTKGVDLGGRSFLHSYEWSRDEGFGVLELIMTAPMVVASWISLQYYGSTVDNEAFGCGNKTLHNVVGALGVFEGNGGDLRTGLPWQSVHDGERFVHEPLRLNVVIEAPIDAMNAIIEKHEHVRHLLDNGWLHLWAMDGEGRIASKYAGDLAWSHVPGTAAARAAA